MVTKSKIFLNFVILGTILKPARRKARNVRDVKPQLRQNEMVKSYSKYHMMDNRLTHN